MLLHIVIIESYRAEQLAFFIDVSLVTYFTQAPIKFINGSANKYLSSYRLEIITKILLVYYPGFYMI